MLQVTASRADSVRHLMRGTNCTKAHLPLQVFFYKLDYHPKIKKMYFIQKYIMDTSKNQTFQYINIEKF